MASKSTCRCKMTTCTGPRARSTPEKTTGTPRRAKCPTCEPLPSTACGTGGGGGFGGFKCARTSSARSCPCSDSNLCSSKMSSTCKHLGSSQDHRQSVVFWSLKSKRPSSAAAVSLRLARLMSATLTNEVYITSSFFFTMKSSQASLFASSGGACGLPVRELHVNGVFGSGRRPSPSQEPLPEAMYCRGRHWPPQPSGTSASTSPRRIITRQSPWTPGRMTVCPSK
mmetsp:Transcript_58887/g.170841  ORF Transcript_58887/g.170841 Transcript_58887/m.170841 type:complete len:226 (+) Transcript_58887:1911-2588(+)